MPRYMVHDRNSGDTYQVELVRAVWIIGNHSDYNEHRAKELLEHTDQHTMIYLPMLAIEMWREE